MFPDPSHDLALLLPDWVTDVHALIFGLLGLCMNFAGKRILDYVPFSLVVAFVAMMIIYAIMFGHDDWFGFRTSVMSAMKYFGFWNAMVIMGMVASLYTAFFVHCLHAITLAEIGWLVSAAVFVPIQAASEVASIDMPDQGLLATRFFLAINAGCYSLYLSCREVDHFIFDYLPAVLMSLAGSHLTMTALNHFLTSQGVLETQCFWPDVTTPDLHHGYCKYIVVSVPLLATAGLLAQSWRDIFLTEPPSPRAREYKPLPPHMQDIVKKDGDFPAFDTLSGDDGGGVGAFV
eukprot:CAMPEP_0206634510 /NCGR_PEP_ID=MMETSP0325_2-20121206/70080_1 /ASSEMBLY_ACC=CAM_ASM_000347 /TAXON_ID=2866 /ORGANISM="Crypthecodinium cohnii, Strain Seligo" /LENGTH=289 /DNA_ID=CAMNT_0054160311 /DNA_START=171 /DNA_END=1038 /DNA_ORIENTATION=+